MGKNAFVLKMKIGEDLAKKGVESDEIIIGWSKAKGLIDENLDWLEFREIIHETYLEADDNYRVSGGWAGSMWRFIRDMDKGDYVVVPSGKKYYVAEVEGEARYEDKHVADDTAHRRKVKWLNNKKPIPRKYARAALQSRMKARQTCVNAKDLIDEIKESLSYMLRDDKKSFAQELRQNLIDQTHRELYSGRLDSYGFEKLGASILASLGGKQVEIIARNKDMGADITADFYVAKTVKLKMAVQAKHFKPKPKVSKDDIDQLVAGMKFENADIGWLLTTGSFSDEVIEYGGDVKEQGLNIELIDGAQLAALIIEEGLSATFNIDKDS